ncbi:hypothetical protein ANCCEY_02540 [Ancylostoma ceylanicum]|uniref:EDRF1 N-terminal domain-containing protein n=1 Tax=Ancylostoma ceylanicum TaxID=53326 RepID=A0A0D6M7J6_9BILA|nr:hypothetical protein ANCCEY_02540 [Ancylostoma ceylanicum]
MIHKYSFGQVTHQLVQHNVHAETKPISVLTGMDIMLDQLMCNLSETVLVYHEQGLVKDYEVLVKEDIPHIVGSEFDPSNLKNITENIMVLPAGADPRVNGLELWLQIHLPPYILRSPCKEERSQARGMDSSSDYKQVPDKDLSDRTASSG